MHFPTRGDVERVLTELANGTMTPAEANDWAAPFVVDERSHPERMDEAVWDALNELYGADLEVGPGEPLHGREDFNPWLEAFRQSP